SVTERTPVAWRKIDDQIRAIDRHGVDYRTLSKPPKDLVEIDVPARGDHQEAVDACAQVIQELISHDADLLKQITTVTANTPDPRGFDVSHGRTVRWGSPGEVDAKLRVLTTLLDTVQAQHYDVSAPARPTTGK